MRFTLVDGGDPSLSPSLEALDLGDGETLGGLFAWMHNKRERQRLRAVLSFDLFDAWRG